jgi:hypothetical protein
LIVTPVEAAACTLATGVVLGAAVLERARAGRGTSEWAALMRTTAAVVGAGPAGVSGVPVGAVPGSVGAPVFGGGALVWAATPGPDAAVGAEAAVECRAEVDVECRAEVEPPRDVEPEPEPELDDPIEPPAPLTVAVRPPPTAGGELGAACISGGAVTVRASAASEF